MLLQWFCSGLLERFFTLSFNNGTVVAQLYNCGSKKYGDSLFMKIGEVVKLTDVSRTRINTDSVAINTINMNRDSTILDPDGGSIYFIQTYSTGQVKNALVRDPFKLEETDDDAKSITTFIRRLNQMYSFQFWDPWEQSKKTALPILEKND